MRLHSRLSTWCRAVIRGRELDQQIGEELQFHIESYAEDLVGTGVPRDEAMRQARAELGSIAARKEDCRAAWGARIFDELSSDLHFAVRILAKRPASNAAVVLALALGIGMNGAMFTFVNALLLRPPQGVRGTNKLVEVWLHNPKISGVQSYVPFNYPDYAYFRDHSKSLEGLMAFDGGRLDAIWNHQGTGEILHGQLVSGNLFPLLSVNAVVGRALTVNDDELDNPSQVAVLSYPFWKQKLGGDIGAVGKTLVLDGAAFTVVGVAPGDFTGPLVAQKPDFWAPIAVQDRFTHDKGE